MRFKIKICDWDKCRDWLVKNKIFFETITAVFLTIMAIVVSFEANQISSYQTEIIKKQQLPILHFEVDQIYDSATSNYTRDELTISNVGSPLSEFKSDYAIFFKIDSGQRDEPPKTALIPLEGYYFHTVITNKPVGELARIANYAIPEGNNYKAGQTMRSFYKYAEERNAWGLIDIVRYVRVKYKDIFGDYHIEYYYVSPLNVFECI